MSNRDLIRAWKDEEFRSSLSEAERAQLPDNPAGAISLDAEVMEERIAPAYLVSNTCCTCTHHCDALYAW